MDQSRSPPHPDRTIDREQPTVVVGWTHRDLARGIELRVQSSRSAIALENGQVETAHLCMTNNQALLLARYLLAVTGQELGGGSSKPRWWRRPRKG
jgi:hypothetical protein